MWKQTGNKQRTNRKQKTKIQLCNPLSSLIQKKKEETNREQTGNK